MRSILGTAAVCGLLLMSRSSAQFSPKGGTLDCVAGAGIFLVQMPGDKPRVQINANTDELLSKLTDQAGTPRYCRSTTGTDAYACALDPSLTIYTAGSCLVLSPDTPNVGAASLDVDTLGVLPILNHAGGTLADGEIPANFSTLICLNNAKTAWSRP